MNEGENFLFDKTSTPKKTVVDYGGANVAKPLHVGHLRAAVIGEAIKRMGRFVGHTVIGDVHLGDWGLQMGLIIEELKEVIVKLEETQFDLLVDPESDYQKKLNEYYDAKGALNEVKANLAAEGNYESTASQLILSGYEKTLEFAKLSLDTIDKSLSGMEFSTGIPGSIGASVAMNAGAYKSDMGYIVSEVRVLTPDLKIKTLYNKDMLKPGEYRNYGLI